MKPFTAAAAVSGVPRHQRPARSREFLFGVAYYPEHWPAREWRRDFQRMAQAGVKVVRLGEFAWDVWEPRRGDYRFELFDDAIALAAKHGLRVVLGTPTSGPPRWLTAAHPDWLRHSVDGRPIDHTGRQHVGLVHEGFRTICRELAAALATHYATHPAVIGWQIDNELHCVGSLDFSPAVRRAFQAWLARRYGRIARLNADWGTAFSAQTYGSFDEVPLPLVTRPDGFPPHPGHLLDFYRFTSDVTVGFVAEQAAVLRAANPRWLLFHNGLFAHLDYWEMARHVDLLGVDLYPGFGGSEGAAAARWAAFKLQLCRAYSGAFLVPELASGPAGKQKRFLETPEPGQMRLWAWQCIAHGAVGVIHFQWRTCRFGQEMHWHGVLEHDARPRRRLRELTQEATEIARVAPRLAHATRETTIAILVAPLQDDAHGAILESFPAPRHQAEHLLGALLAQHLPAGLVHASDSFNGLKAIVMPSFGWVAPELARKLGAFVHAGGFLVCTARTGTRDAFNKALPHTAPGPLARLLGATVEETGGLRAPLLAFCPGRASPIVAQPGYEILKTHRARAIAQWSMLDASTTRQPHPAVAQPAATLHRVGRGRAVLLGAWINADNAPAFAAWLSELANWQPLAAADAGVEASRLRTPRGSLLFLLNHTPEPQRATGLRAGRELIGGRRTGTAVELPPFGVAVIAEK